MELKIRKNGEIYIIDVNGEMDLYNSYKLKELVMKMLEKNVHSFVINLEQVDYIDSSGIGALIYICSTIKKLNLKLSIANIHGSVKKVIEKCEENEKGEEDERIWEIAKSKSWASK